MIRIYNPLLGIVKGPVDRPVEFTAETSNGKRAFSVDSDYAIVIAMHGIHTSKRHWGEDALEWRPSRFIETDEKGQERLITPPKGVFQPWSDGMRSCPGRKFAYVEHVATMAAIFYAHSVAPVRQEGETAQQTKGRVMRVVNDMMINLTLEMRHPEKAPLVWSKCP